MSLGRLNRVLLTPFVRQFLGERFSRWLFHHVSETISPLACIRHSAQIYNPALTKIGDGSIVGFKCELHAWGEIHIGENVIISPQSVILTGSHNIQTEEYGSLIKPVFIDDYAWIGFGAMILPGVRIGRGAVVGAGSIVTKDVEPYSIVGGNPARHLKWRGKRELTYVPASWYIPDYPLVEQKVS